MVFSVTVLSSIQSKAKCHSGLTGADALNPPLKLHHQIQKLNVLTFYQSNIQTTLLTMLLWIMRARLYTQIVPAVTAMLWEQDFKQKGREEKQEKLLTS